MSSPGGSSGEASLVLFMFCEFLKNILICMSRMSGILLMTHKIYQKHENVNRTFQAVENVPSPQFQVLSLHPLRRRDPLYMFYFIRDPISSNYFLMYPLSPIHDITPASEETAEADLGYLKTDTDAPKKSENQPLE